MIKAAAGVPGRALIAVGRNSDAVLDLSRQVQRFQVINVVLRLVKSFSGPPEPGSRIGGAGSRFSQPIGIGLGRDDVAQVLK